MDNIIFEGASYLTLDHEMVSKIAKEPHSPKTQVYSVLDAQDGLEMTQFMVDKLNRYVDTQAI